ncbi:IS30 family transposase [Paracoccus sp. EF6]|uniref:IS30 family transposase n=1 Tax=Paracoccus benzoatiresistens TaxID=2997341 RepID=A0ABT4JAX2_9RHOB|nr:IS30 family transposase [Paracoccus sp. EF6]MCZ0964229.1 IS30 family transposase [Paracoccus sp. EF6]
MIRCLQGGWSPEQIAGRLRIEPGAPHRLCHETIYQYVYSAEGQSAQLARLLPERRRKRKPRYARTPRNRVFPAETSIHNRPSEINDRSQFGNWEGDLMIFERAQGDANVATLVERKTRYTVLLRNNDRKSRPLMNRLIQEMSPLPAEARRSITFDRGLEFVAWRELETGMGTKAWLSNRATSVKPFCKSQTGRAFLARWDVGAEGRVSSVHRHPGGCVCPERGCLRGQHRAAAFRSPQVKPSYVLHAVHRGCSQVLQNGLTLVRDRDASSYQGF